MDVEHVSSQNPIEDKASRTITVTNIPPQTTQDSIIIHFQKRKHGGGDVEAVRSTDGIAYVTFGKGETVDAVLGKPVQLLNGSLLCVTRYRPLPQAPRKASHGSTGSKAKVFERVAATINQELFRGEDPLIRDLMHKIKEELNIDVSTTEIGFQVSGTLEEILRSHDILQDSLLGVSGWRSFLDEEIRPENLKLDEHCKDVIEEENPTVGNDTEGEKRKEAETADDNSDDGFGIFHLDYAQLGDGDVGVLEIEPQEFKTAPFSLKFLLAFNNQALWDLQLGFDVRIDPSTDHTSVMLFPGKGCDANMFNGACDDFFSFYQGACSGMISGEVSLDLPHGKSIRDYSTADIEVGLPVLIEHGSKPSELVLYGDTASVNAAKERFLSLSVLEDSWEFFDNRMVYRNHNDESDREPRETIMKKTSTGATLSVWKGDITRLKVKAIVNPANGYLKHVAGLASVISKAGGKKIQEESDSIVRSQGKVSIGSAVHTKAGRLPCEFVIHAVGPEWSLHDDEECGRLLSAACLESLQIAQKIGVKSIAFPAISSGLFGVPLDVCAAAMLNGVQEYLKTNASRKKDVRDIRFVHIDDDAVEIFEKELLKRYPK